MRGDEIEQAPMFSYRLAEDRIPADHPLRSIRLMTDRALRQISGPFEKLYSKLGRRSIPPEQLLRALLLQVLYSIRSERMLIEQLDYNILFRWFVGLDLDQEVWDSSSFSKNRQRLLDGDIAQAFFEAVLQQARESGLLSNEHFTVDGTLLEAWASKKSYRKREDPPKRGAGRGGKQLLRDTHECTTDPDARMYRKSAGGEFKLCHMGHVLMENRSGLPVAARVTEAINSAEWDAGLEMLKELETRRKHVTIGADAAYDYQRFVEGARSLGATPHVAQHKRRTSSLDARTTRHSGYAVSLDKRKRVEQIFGWLKTTGMLRKVHHRGRALVEWSFTLALAAFSLVRIRNLTVQAAVV